MDSVTHLVIRNARAVEALKFAGGAVIALARKLAAIVAAVGVVAIGPVVACFAFVHLAVAT